MKTARPVLIVLSLPGVVAPMASACAPAASTATPPSAKPAVSASPTAAPPASPSAATKAPAAATTAPAVTPTTKPAATATVSLDPPLFPPVHIKMGVTPVFAYTAVFAGIEKGYFKEQGLDMELVNFGTGAEMTAPLSTGEFQIGRGWPWGATSK